MVEGTKVFFQKKNTRYMTAALPGPFKQCTSQIEGNPCRLSKSKIIILILLSIFLWTCVLLSRSKPQRIFAFIHTFPDYIETRARAVEKTWARRLDDYVLSTIEDKNERLKKKWIIRFSDGEHNSTSRFWLWDRIRAGFKKMHAEKGDQFDWFMKADDDTYYVVDNLRVLLSKYDPSEPWYLGEMVEASGHVYPSGGTGYVLSREALRRFMEIIDDPSKCNTTSQEMEDIQIGLCFENAGLKRIDNVNEKGEHTMIPINLAEILPSKLHRRSFQREWYTESAHTPVEQGAACCSENLISVHYMSYDEMYVYDYLLYKVVIRK